MSQNNTIAAGKGIGSILFGMQKEDVHAILGEPTEKERDAYGDDTAEVIENWHYDELELSLAFDEEEDGKLITMATSSEDATLNGKSLVGIDKEALKTLLKEQSVKDLEYEDWTEEDEPKHELMYSAELEMNFWFNEDELTEIQMGPFFLDEDTINWPA